MRKPQTQHSFEFPVLLLPQLSVAQTDSLLVIKPDHLVDGATMKTQSVFRHSLPCLLFFEAN